MPYPSVMSPPPAPRLRAWEAGVTELTRAVAELVLAQRGLLGPPGAVDGPAVRARAKAAACEVCGRARRPRRAG
jgi:hypothetical protein